MTASRNTKSDALLGALEMMILRTLTLGSLHGYAIAQHIARTSDGELRIEQGSLYPALYRLEDRGWLSSYWSPTENIPRSRRSPFPAPSGSSTALRWNRARRCATRMRTAATAG